MPHQCVSCNEIYEDGADEILEGCECGGKLFFYVKEDDVSEAKDTVVDLSEDEKEEIEDDVNEIIDSNEDDDPIVLDFESIQVNEAGKYDIDLVKLLKGDPVVFKAGEGKYVIDLPETFKEE